MEKLQKQVIELKKEVFALRNIINVLRRSSGDYFRWKRRKNFVKPFWLTPSEVDTSGVFNEDSLPHALAIPSQRYSKPRKGEMTRINIMLSAEADFEADCVLCAAFTKDYRRSNALAVMIQTLSDGRKFSDIPVHSLGFGDSVDGLFYLPEPMFFFRASIINVEFTLLKPERLFVYFALIGRKFFMLEEHEKKLSSGYSTGKISLGKE